MYLGFATVGVVGARADINPQHQEQPMYGTTTGGRGSY